MISKKILIKEGFHRLNGISPRADIVHMSKASSKSPLSALGNIQSEIHSSDGFDTEKDLRTFELLKPYLAHCLSMNHELNNSLAGIIGYCDLLIDDPTTPEDISLQISQILFCANRIKEHVDQLCFEKIELSNSVDMRELKEQYEPHASELAPPHPFPRR